MIIVYMSIVDTRQTHMMCYDIYMCAVGTGRRESECTLLNHQCLGILPDLDPIGTKKKSDVAVSLERLNR